jgi:hypothetical protein
VGTFCKKTPAIRFLYQNQSSSLFSFPCFTMQFAQCQGSRNRSACDVSECLLDAEAVSTGRMGEAAAVEEAPVGGQESEELDEQERLAAALDAISCLVSDSLPATLFPLKWQLDRDRLSHLHVHHLLARLRAGGGAEAAAALNEALRVGGDEKHACGRAERGPARQHHGAA